MNSVTTAIVTVTGVALFWWLYNRSRKLKHSTYRSVVKTSPLTITKKAVLSTERYYLKPVKAVNILYGTQTGISEVCKFHKCAIAM